jgi:hypothetical protein
MIGTYKILPANTSVWSVALQDTVKFDKDKIIELTNGIYSDKNAYFSKIKIKLFGAIGIPTLIDASNGELGCMDVSKLQDCILYEPYIVEFFENNENTTEETEV